MSGPFLLFLRIGMALSLYLFIGWAFFFLWKNFKVESELLASRKTPPLALTFTNKNNLTETKHFRDPEITLGRDPQCEVYLEDETVSAYHARLSYHHGQWWLEDLESTNGTTLNGEKVKTPTIIISNDNIRCGEAALTVRLAIDDLSPNTQKID
jgi:pSer/pThr/pTyr-binding forkhead associated (FHA) protein